MSKAVKLFAWILLPVMCISLVLGYATLTDELLAGGSVSVDGKPFEGVYIFDASVYSVSGATSVSYAYYLPTTFSSTTSPTGAGSSITYKITVHNNTNVTYWYIGPDYETSVGSNSLIGSMSGITVMTKDHPNDTTQTFNSDDWIPPQTYRDFYVTYTFYGNAQTYPVTLINYQFGIKMDAVYDKFLAVLNDSSAGGGYEYLSQAFDEKYAETGEVVIANIGEEAEIFNNLFGSDMTINVDGVEVPVTVMIRRENVDGRTTGDTYENGTLSGCEYTVYITVDPLDSPTGEAIVYAISYSKGGVAGSDWYKLGQLYEGTAKIVDYDPNTPGMQGAFDYEDWIATPNQYTVANGITYLVGQEQGDQYDKLKTLTEIMSSADQDIFNDIDNKRIFKTVYDIVYNSANVNKPGWDGLRKAFEDAAPFYNIMNNGQEIKVKRNCTRAEIIPYILNIQTALDYYNQVNP